MRVRSLLVATLAAAMVVGGCTSEEPDVPDNLEGSGGDEFITIAAAGDVCEAPDGATNGCAETSDLILSRGADWVLLAGDAQYNNGELEHFEEVYDPTWGRFKDRTLPVPGNHDQFDSGYSTYFADAGLGPSIPQNWIKDLGGWSITGVDSNDVDDAAAFVKDNLPTADFDLLLWHHARYSSGSDHGSDDSIDPLWDAARQAGGCINIVSHDHIYERLAYEGMHQFTVGTGGGEQHDDFVKPALVAGSEQTVAQVHAVLFMNLYPDGRYEFQLVDVSNTVLDSGSGKCDA